MLDGLTPDKQRWRCGAGELEREADGQPQQQVSGCVLEALDSNHPARTRRLGWAAKLGHGPSPGTSRRASASSTAARRSANGPHFDSSGESLARDFTSSVTTTTPTGR